ncbi:MAG TPA: cupin domain-containing protein [Polyangiaceae bacterium]|nr:cupin domain-containing protein [Polyangiaceae bacterium]
MTRWMLGSFLLAACGPPPHPEASEPTAPAATAAPAPAPPAAPSGEAPLSHEGLPPPRVAATMGLTEATAGPVIMSTDALAEGESVALAPSPDHEHLVLVLTGELELAPGDAPGALVRAWHVARARGVPVVLRAVKPSRLVTAFVDGEPITKRDVEVINLVEREPLTWAGGKAHAWLGFEDGRASFGLLLSHPDVGVPRHAHEDSTEVVGLLSGEGIMGIGDESREVASGDVLVMPKGVEHDYTPAGTETLFAVQLYLPPGPEQRFKDLAKKEADGP